MADAPVRAAQEVHAFSQQSLWPHEPSPSGAMSNQPRASEALYGGEHTAGGRRLSPSGWNEGPQVPSDGVRHPRQIKGGTGVATGKVYRL